MQRMLWSLALCLVMLSSEVRAAVAIRGGVNRALLSEVDKLIDAAQYRSVRVQPLVDTHGQVDRLLVYLHSKKYHRVDFAMVLLDQRGHVVAFQRHHRLTPDDLRQQPGYAATAAACPDPAVEFIAFAPNDDAQELSITDDVAQAAVAAGLKTVELTKAQATRQAYLNYMTCPNLRGNFYDGDADPTAITTNDGLVTATDIQTVLAGAFRFKLTNIWLACEAYNNPMLAAAQTTAKSRKYAAGVNDLEIGPSDQAAACAMKAAIAGQPLTSSFQSCVQKLDNSSDHWGFGGQGTDVFAP